MKMEVAGQAGQAGRRARCRHASATLPERTAAGALRGGQRVTWLPPKKIPKAVQALRCAQSQGLLTAGHVSPSLLPWLPFGTESYSERMHTKPHLHGKEKVAAGVPVLPSPAGATCDMQGALSRTAAAPPARPAARPGPRPVLQWRAWTRGRAGRRGRCAACRPQRPAGAARAHRGRSSALAA